MVFGPASDGGYWLIGCRAYRCTHGFLKDVRWSTEHALADSIKSAGDTTIAFVDALDDIDTLADLELHEARQKSG